MTDQPAALQRHLRFGDLILTDAPFLVEFGMDYTAGDLVTSVLSSFLQDGDLEVSQRRGNLSLTIPLLLEGNDLLELAQAEAALALEAQKPTNTLTINPGDGYGPATVFDTFEADVAFAFDDTLETHAMRRLVIKVSALPFGRSEHEVEAQAVTAPTGAPVTAPVNDASSTDGWTSNPPGTTVAANGGRVSTTSVGAVGPTGRSTAGLQLAQSVDCTSTPFVYWDWACSRAVDSPTLTVDGVRVPGVANLPSPTAGFTRSYFMVPASVHTVMAFLVATSAGPATIAVDQVSRSNVSPSQGTRKQQIRSVDVLGSARTQARIEVSSQTSSLGDVLLYSRSDPGRSYSPSLREYEVDGSPTQDADAASGLSTSLAGNIDYIVPTDQLDAGLYVLVARVKSATSQPRLISWTAQALVGSSEVGRPASGGGVFAGGPYAFVPLGTVHLTTAGFTTDSIGTQRFRLTDASADPARLDNLYAFNLTAGRLSIVSCGSGTPASGGASRRLWLNAASVTNRTPSVMRGHAADASDAFSATDLITALGLHEFIPPSAYIFTVTTNAVDTEVSLAHSPRWLGHAAS